MANALIQPHELAAMNRLEAEAAIRERARSVYLGDRTAIVRALGRYKLSIDTRDRGFGAHLLLDGFWEMWLTLFCARNLRNDMVAIDVGANYGYYALMFAEFIGAKGQLFAVEPNPRAFDLLQRNIELNGFAERTVAVQLALGNTDHGSTKLFVPHTEPKNASVVDYAGDPARGITVDVASSTLDWLCSSLTGVDFIKIDAEGSEEKIFAGMAKLLTRCKPTIVVEVNVARYADPSGFLSRLSGLYGNLYHVAFDGTAASVSIETLLTQRVGEDWLVVLSATIPS